MKFKSMLITTMGVLAVQLCTAASTTATTTGSSATVSQVKPMALIQTDKDKMSYALGATLGENMKKTKVDVDATLFIKGFNDAFTGGQVLMNGDEIKAAMMKFQEEMMQKQEATQKVEADRNAVQGENFLKNNKTNPGVISLPDGLQYKVVKAGTGVKPTKEDTVVVNYEGKLFDGKVFDSSYKNGKPASFRVADVIRGWQEVLQLMPVGSTWEVYIPANLAYGPAGVPGHIPPNAVLIFKVDLVSIKKSDDTPA